MNFKNPKLAWELLPKNLSEALGTVLFVLFFSFFPIFALAIKYSASYDNMTFSKAFGEFFNSGELSFYILSITGSILWCIGTRRYPKSVKPTLLLICSGALILTSILMSDNVGISSLVNPSILKMFLIMYLGLLIIWFFSLFAELEYSPKDDAKKADGIISASRKRSK